MNLHTSPAVHPLNLLGRRVCTYHASLGRQDPGAAVHASVEPARFTGVGIWTLCCVLWRYVGLNAYCS